MISSGAPRPLAVPRTMGHASLVWKAISGTRISVVAPRLAPLPAPYAPQYALTEHIAGGSDVGDLLEALALKRLQQSGGDDDVAALLEMRA